MARIKVRRERRQTPGKFKLRKPQWIDPYPQIPGTEPEKRVFAMLMTMGVFFGFQTQVPEFEKGGSQVSLAPIEYKPDFVLYEYKCIIDPFSPFHHSLKGAVERDVDKVAKYSAIGYAYYHPWAIAPGLWTWDQYVIKEKKLVLSKRTTIRLYQGVNAARNSYRGVNRTLVGRKMGTLFMLMSIPEIGAGPRYPLTDPKLIKAKQAPGYFVGPFEGAGANSVGAANHKRRKPPKMGVTVGSRRSIRRAR